MSSCPSRPKYRYLGVECYLSCCTSICYAFRKSSIIRLLYRFFEPNSGEILIAGQKINDVELDSLRRSISIVPQDSVLFHDTIFYNLQYGNLQKNENDVYEAAKLAELHDNVMSWPKKYQTEVRTLKLSLRILIFCICCCQLIKQIPTSTYFIFRWEKGG